MKVITEERLKEKLKEQIDKLEFKNNQFMSDSPYVENIKAVILNELINELQELDTLTVTRLRPMCDAPRDGRYIKVCFYSGSNQYHSELFVRWNEKHQAWEEYMVDPEEETHQDYAFDGFIDVPRYEPEK